MKPMPFAIAALLAGLAPIPAVADPGSQQTREFVQAAAESDTFEMMESHTALVQSKDPGVVAFAKQMIRDHGESRSKLTQAAQRAGLKPPVMAVGASQSPLLAALQSARGPAFDKLYWEQQALAHRATLVTEQGYAAFGDVPAMRLMASAMIPMIRSHLAMAEKMTASAR